MNSDLMQAFHFTADDLMHNKQGRLSPQQVTRLKSNNRTGAIILFILLLVSVPVTVFLLWPFIFNGLEVANSVNRWLRLGSGIGLGLLSLLFLLNIFKFLLRTDNPVVTKVEGMCHGIISRREGSEETGGRVTVYYAQIGEQELRLYKRQVPIIQAENTYAFYVDKVLGILSVEHLGGPPEV
jgi:hypothetical protein